MTKEHSKKVPKKKRSKAKVLVVLFFVLLVLAIAVYVGLKIATPAIKESQEKADKQYQISQLYKQGTGGNPQDVIDYHNKAVAAWKSGDKKKAKELAQKGLDANRQLTNKQQLDIPGQSNVILNLDSIKRGKKPYDL